jgi:hypothetical protein
LHLSNRGTRTVAGRISKATDPIAAEPWPEGNQ